MVKQRYEPRKVIYFVRHGQSVDNVLPVFQPPDSPLSKAGEQQAGQIADRLTHLSFDALISSPLPRTKQTATAISEATGKPIEFSDLFVERVKPKAVEGKPVDDPEASRIWREWDATIYLPGIRDQDGETYDEIIERADAALEYLRNRPETSLVVVTHSYFLRTIVARVLLGDHMTGPLLKRFQTHATVENTGLTVLHYREAFEEEAAWRLWTFNDHAHFAE